MSFIRLFLTTGLATVTASVGLCVGYGVALGPPSGNCCCSRDESTKKKRSTTPSKSSSVETYDKLAKTFDDELNFHEFFTGIDFLRTRLVWRAKKGDVLEAACGTGRNLNKYPFGEKMLKRVVLTDASGAMVKETREKIFLHSRVGNDGTTEIKAEVDDATRMKQKSNSFDYVVMTFGLCSTANPGKVVKELARVTKPNGEILMLEHGRPPEGSVHDYWLSNILDAHVDMHEKKWGCAWNKDIEKIVRESVGDTCDVVTFDRWHFGTTSYIVLRKREL